MRIFDTLTGTRFISVGTVIRKVATYGSAALLGLTIIGAMVHG